MVGYTTSKRNLDVIVAIFLNLTINNVIENFWILLNHSERFQAGNLISFQTKTELFESRGEIFMLGLMTTLWKLSKLGLFFLKLPKKHQIQFC